MITFIIQARCNSSRFHNKILYPFFRNKNLLEILIERLLNIESTNIIVATSDNKDCDDIESIALKYGVLCYRGSERDVLQRFIDAANFYHVNEIIRVCADNPFLDINSIYELIKYSKENNDYIAFDICGTPSIKTHYGFWAEYVHITALERIRALTSDPVYHEHVTNFIYANPDIFKIKWINTPIDALRHSNIRLTIDTITDFILAQKIYNDICLCNNSPTITNVISYLEEHPYLQETMRTEILNNVK